MILKFVNSVILTIKKIWSAIAKAFCIPHGKKRTIILLYKNERYLRIILKSFKISFDIGYRLKNVIKLDF